jgi:hypothetical protein
MLVVLTALQKDIPLSCAKVGVDCLAFGSSESGHKSVKMTLAFFVHVVRLVLKFKNFKKCSEFVREDMMSQFSAALYEAVAQVREGRSLSAGDTPAALAKLRALCDRACSPTSLQNVFTFYLRHEGAACIRMHYEGIVQARLLITLFHCSADADTCTHHLHRHHLSECWQGLLVVCQAPVR